MDEKRGSCLDAGTLIRFAEGGLTASARKLYETHILSCQECGEAVAALPSARTEALGPDESTTVSGTVNATDATCQLEGPLEGSKPKHESGPRPLPEPWFSPGEHVGRYVVIKCIGQGGVGQVYLAKDPKLARNIALKLVHREHSDQQQVRLIREAQAMARLSHRNVVSVHDAGTASGRAFIAMEFVDGPTLRDWLKTEARPWRQIIKVFLSAGKGLMAAHEAGVIHRDFKPANVLLDSENTALVTDFGIAHAALSENAEVPLEAPSISHDDLSLFDSDLRLTDVGIVLGTPIYMSAEQHGGKPTDERSDQFSFCVALFEAIYKIRPFAGRNIDELAKNISDGNVITPEKVPGVPKALGRIILRGLEADPDQRYPHLQELLVDFQSLLGRRKRRITFASGAVALSVLGALFWWAQARSGDTASAVECGGGKELFATVWGPQQKKAIAASFLATGVPHAEATWVNVERAMGEYATRFAATHRDACQATRIRGTQSDEVLTLRMECLRDRLDDTRLISEIFLEADEGVVSEAVAATHAASDLRACDEARVVGSRVSPPAAHEVAEVEELELELRRIRSLQIAGRVKAANAAIELLAPKGQILGYRPLNARVSYTHALLSWSLGDARAEAQAELAMLDATSVGDRRLATQATILLARTIGNHSLRKSEALRWTRQAHSLLDSVDDARIAAEVPSVRAYIHQVSGSYLIALEHAELAQALLEAILDPRDPELAGAYTQRGKMLAMLGRVGEARSAHLHAQQLLSAALSAKHPSVIPALYTLGGIHALAGEAEEAVGAFTKACALIKEHFGPKHPKVGKCLNNLSIPLTQQGKLLEAQSVLEEALVIFQNPMGTPHPLAGATLSNLAETLSNQGKHDEALKSLVEAQDLLVATYGPNHPNIAANLVVWGRGLCDQGRAACITAQSHFTRVLAIFTDAFGAESVELAEGYTGLARTELASEHPDKAWELGKQAVKLAEGAPKRVLLRGRAHTIFAQATWAKGDAADALVLADKAQALLTEANRDSEQESIDLEKLAIWRQSIAGL